MSIQLNTILMFIYLTTYLSDKIVKIYYLSSY